MKIVADEHLALIPELFGNLGTVNTLPGRAIGNRDLHDAEVLLVRSVTRVDREMLANTPVKFVGSATIGTDHVELEYLRQQGIVFSNAPGCNAQGVVDYVIAALCTVEPDWLNRTVAIVGCGNVGGRLYRCLRRLGVRCLCYDPFLDPAAQPDLVAFDDLFEADIVCLHTPLTVAGPHPTLHLFNRARLERLRPGTVLLNAGRGAVIDNLALRRLLASGADLRVVLDVWEPEPDIDLQLLASVTLGTAHIAGYSFEGKTNGSRMVAEALCHWLGRPMPALPALPSAGTIKLTAGQGLADAVLTAYEIAADHRQMLQVLEVDREECSGQPPGPAANRQAVSRIDIGDHFDDLRKLYHQRREYSSFEVRSVNGEALAGPLCRQLRAVGFQVPDAPA